MKLVFFFFALTAAIVFEQIWKLKNEVIFECIAQKFIRQTQDRIKEFQQVMVVNEHIYKQTAVKKYLEECLHPNFFATSSHFSF